MTVVASRFERKHLDLYETEPWATEALLRNACFAGDSVWEPAAGNHMIADVLARYGATVITSDIATYDREHSFQWDFLWGLELNLPSEADAIITNPPYGKGNRDAVRFAELSLERCAGYIALLLTAKFDFGKTRKHLFADCPRFMMKIALVDRIQWFPGDTSGTEDHAWYVWGPDTYQNKVLVWEGRQ